MARLFPDVGADVDQWGSDLEIWSNVEHDLNDGTHKWPGTPDGTKFLADNRTWTRPAQTVQIKVMDDATSVTTGDGKFIFIVPPQLDLRDLIDADAYITTLSTSGLIIVQIANLTTAFDTLTTRITIDVGEYHSYTAATAPVIDTAHDQVHTGDRLSIDVDGAGTGAKGLGVVLSFR
jgi:hypothetical protein